MEYCVFAFNDTIKLLMNYRTSPAFTLPQSSKKNIFQMPEQDYSSPGPMYNTWGLGIKQVSTSHSIGNSRRTEINHWVQRTPSPALYTPEKKAKKHAVTITKAQRKDQVNPNPDPTWYNPQLQTVRPKSPVYSLAAKYGSIMDDVNDHPGPGHYETKRDMTILTKSKSEKSTMFTTADRFAKTNTNPGVGDYQIANKSGLVTNKCTIGNGQRDPITKPIVPAPTEYRKVSLFDEGVKKRMGKSISMKLKGCFVQDPLTSQAYNKYFKDQNMEPTNFRASQQFTIPKQKREIFPDNKLPGPSDYNSHTYVKKNSHNVIIPQSTYQPFHEVIDNPAPGTYRIELQKGKKYTIPRAKSAAIARENPAIGRYETIVADHPGVGRYNVSKGMQRGGSAVPKSARTNFVSKNTAGVGDYQIRQKVRFKGTIGKSQRFKKVQQMPGPGDYHIQSIIGYKSKRL